MITTYMNELHCAVYDSNIFFDEAISSFSSKFFALFKDKNLKSEKAKKALESVNDKLIAKIKSCVSSVVRNDFSPLKYGCYFILNELSILLKDAEKDYSLESKVDDLVFNTISVILKDNEDYIRTLQIYNLIDVRVDSDFMSIFGVINSTEKAFPYESVSKLEYNSVFSAIIFALSKKENESVLNYYLNTDIDPHQLLKNQSTHCAYFSFFDKLFPKNRNSAIFYSLALTLFKAKIANFATPLEAKLKSAGRC